MTKIRALAIATGALALSGPAVGQELAAKTLRRIPAPQADQGAAFGMSHVYAVDNSVIAKYDLKTGEQAAIFEDAGKLLRHMNSCLVIDARLMCANSNYPQLPMGSSVEIFDANSLAHLESHSLGLMDEGSLVWFDRIEGGWLAGFAHYDGERGVGFKNHAYASVIAMDGKWRRTGGWLFPESVAERFAPHAASGGAIGPDGLLYVMGHDRPEMYVLAKPLRGPVLQHVATIAIEAEGQAFSFAPDGSRRVAAVDRRRGTLLLIDLPEIGLSSLTEDQFFRQP